MRDYRRFVGPHGLALASRKMKQKYDASTAIRSTDLPPTGRIRWKFEDGPNKENYSRRNLRLVDDPKNEIAGKRS